MFSSMTVNAEHNALADLFLNQLEWKTKTNHVTHVVLLFSWVFVMKGQMIFGLADGTSPLSLELGDPSAAFSSIIRSLAPACKPPPSRLSGIHTQLLMW